MKNILKKYDLGYKLLAVFLSIITWFVVMEMINPDVRKTVDNVPVIIYGKSALKSNNLEVINEVTDRFSVRVEGNRKALLNMSADDIELVADVTNIVLAGENIGIDLRVNIKSDSSVSVRNSDELKVRLVVDEIVEADVALKLRKTGSPEEGYEDAGEDRFNQTVHVRGPRLEVERIREAVVEVGLDGVSANIESALPVVFLDNAGNELELKYTHPVNELEKITVYINLVKEVGFEVQVNSGGGLTKDDVTVSFAPDTILVSAQESQLKGRDVLNQGIVDLSEIDPGTQSMVKEIKPIVLYGLNIKGAGATLYCTVTVDDVVTKEFTCAVELIGSAPEGLTVTPEAETTTVVLRGNRRLLDGIKPEDIRVTVNLDELEDLVEGAFVVTSVRAEVQNGYKATVERTSSVRLAVFEGER